MQAGPLKAQAQGITFDEFGRPFIILKEQETQKRLTGLEAHKVSGVPSTPFRERRDGL